MKTFGCFIFYLNREFFNMNDQRSSIESDLSSGVLLFPRRLCETRAGNVAYAVGRIAFLPGRPMLVEHLGGLYLEHSLHGAVLRPGFGPEYDIAYVFPEESRGRFVFFRAVRRFFSLLLPAGKRGLAVLP